MAATNEQMWLLADEQRQALESWLVEFDRSWHEGRLAERASTLPRDGPLRLPALVEMVKIDLERQWQRGARPTLEGYLAAYTELGGPDGVPLDLIQTEYEVRLQFGDTVQVEEYARRFPRRAEAVRLALTRARQALGPPPAGSGSVTPKPDVDTPPLPSPAGNQPVSLPEKFGRYRIVRCLGRGGMGSVYLAHDRQLDRPVALKVPHFSAQDGPEVLERFHREARAAATLRHPGICPVYDVGRIDDVPYLTMAFVEGESLADRLRGGWRPAPEEAARLVQRLAAALAEAHQHGVIHRDLKPSNIMVDRRGEPVVMDFGLAARPDQVAGRLTRTGQLVGTPAYMAPEQVKSGGPPAGPAADVYGLGVILYELLTGHVPFEGDLLAVLGRLLTEEAPPPSLHRPELDPRLAAICRKALAREPGERFPTMAALAAALGDWLAARPTGRTRRRRWLIAAGGVALVLVVAVVVGVVFRDGNKTGPPDPGRSVPEVFSKGPDRKALPVAPTEKPVVRKAEEPEKPLPARKDSPEVGPPQPITKDGGLGPLTYLAFSPNGKYVALGGEGTDVLLWHVATGKRRWLTDRSGRIRCLAFSRDSKRLAVGSYKRAQLWEVATGKELDTLKGHSEAVTDILFFTDGKGLVTASQNEALVWGAAPGKGPLTFKGRGSGNWVLFPDGKALARCASFFNGNRVYRWDVATQTSRTPIDPGGFGGLGSILIAAGSADGRSLVVGQNENVLVYDAATREKLTAHSLHTKDVISVALAPDGQTVVSGSIDRTAILWDVRADKERATLKGHKGPVVVRFCRAGTLVVTYSRGDECVRLWDARTGRERACVRDRGMTRVKFAVVSQDGKVLATTDFEGRVRLWNVDALLRAGK
jgi:hypothetical protein